MDFLRIASKFDSKKGFFLLAGKFDIKNFPEHEQKEIRRLLQTKGRDNCYFRLTHIDSPPEFNALVDCCDVLYLAYKNHYHSSGLLAKAALFNKPVIVSNGYCMGQRVTRYNLGLTVSSAYSQKLEAVNQLADKAFRNTIRESTGFATYNSQNSTRALNSALQLLLSQD